MIPRELHVSRRLDLVIQSYRAGGATGLLPGWQTMRCECRFRSVFGVSAAWRGRGLAVYLYPRPGWR